MIYNFFVKEPAATHKGTRIIMNINVELSNDL